MLSGFTVLQHVVTGASSAAAENFWNNEPFAANGGYQDDSRIHRWVFGD